MTVKIIFAFALLLVSILLVTRKSTLLKIIGTLGLLLWLFIGDWGGLELAKKGFTFFQHHVMLSLEIIAGCFIGVIVLGWLLNKLSPGKGAGKHSRTTATTSTTNDTFVYSVGGQTFDNESDAIAYAQEHYPNTPPSDCIQVIKK